MQATINVRVEGKEFSLDPRFAKVSELLNELLNNKDGDEAIQLSPDFVRLEQFNVIKRYYETNNYEPKEIVIQSDDPQQVFNQIDYEIIMKYNPLDGKDLLYLIQAAIYLNVKSFKARIAIEFYVDRNNSQKDLEKLFKKFPQVPPITIQDVEVYRQKNPNLFNQYF